MSELDGYYEQIANRSKTGAGSSNLTGALGAQLGATNTVAGGTNEKDSSSLIGNNSVLTEHGSANIYNTSPEVRTTEAVAVNDNVYESITSTGTTTQLIVQSGQAATRKYTLSHIPVSLINSVISGTAGNTYSSYLVNPSGAGWSGNGNTIAWVKGTYPTWNVAEAPTADTATSQAFTQLGSGVSRVFTMTSTPVTAFTTVVSGTAGSAFPTYLVGASGAGWSGNVAAGVVTWLKGTWTTWSAAEAAGLVPISGNQFTVNYNYTQKLTSNVPVSGAGFTVNYNYTYRDYSLVTPPVNYPTEQARLGNQMPGSNNGNAGLGPEIFR